MPIGGPSTVPIVPQIQSDALSLADANNVFLPAVMGIFGLDPNVPPVDPAKTAFYYVRPTYPTLGAPPPPPGDDITFLTPAPIDDDYNRVRDEAYTDAGDGIHVNKTIKYTRVWSVRFVLYGPNSLDRARKIRSGFYETEEIHDYLAQQDLFLVPDNPEPIRSPEQFDSQWYERVDFELRFNEGITESVIYQTVESVEIIVEESQAGELADITIQET